MARLEELTSYTLKIPASAPITDIMVRDGEIVQFALKHAHLLYLHSSLPRGCN